MAALHSAQHRMAAATVLLSMACFAAMIVAVAAQPSPSPPKPPRPSPRPPRPSPRPPRPPPSQPPAPRPQPPPSSAVFSSVLRAPVCSTPQTMCDSGPTLLKSRGTVAPAEPNQPNALFDSCADGNFGAYTTDEHIDRITVAALGPFGSVLTSGQGVQINVTRYCTPEDYSYDFLDVYMTKGPVSDAASVAWAPVAVNVTCAGPTNDTVFTAYWQLPAGITTQSTLAVRAVYRYLHTGGPSPCPAASVGNIYDDVDDLAFAVAPDTIFRSPTLQVPYCDTPQPICDSGPDFFQDQSNSSSLYASCPDGGGDIYDYYDDGHIIDSEEHGLRLAIKAEDWQSGGVITSGKNITIELTRYCVPLYNRYYVGINFLDLFISQGPIPGGPAGLQWETLVARYRCVGWGGVEMARFSYRLPPALTTTTTFAVRAINSYIIYNSYEYDSPPEIPPLTTCPAPGYPYAFDNDDIAFAVARDPVFSPPPPAPPNPPPVQASYDAIKGVPYCSATSVCDSGDLLRNQAESEPEPHAPNSLFGTCSDFSAEGYPRGIERIVVSNHNSPGRTIASGTTLSINVTAFCPENTRDDFHLNILISRNSLDNSGQGLAWRLLAKNILCPTFLIEGRTINYTVYWNLPFGIRTYSTYAVRATFVYNYAIFTTSNVSLPASAICPAGFVEPRPYDVDDLAFQVAPDTSPSPPRPPPSPPPQPPSPPSPPPRPRSPPPSPPPPNPPSPLGVYRRRTDSDFLISKTWGIDIWAFDVVSSQAVINCRRIMEGMMSAAPGLTVPNGMRKYGLTVAIIGRWQKLTDLKPYAFLRGVATSDGRLWDDVRGIGAPGTAFPYSSAAEENLLFLPSDPYTPYESIMVREFAHSVLNVGLFDAGTNTAVVSAFNAAVTRNAGSFGSVRPAGFQDKDEYWAVMSEAWFESITRRDINLGITTRSSLLIVDPAIAGLFQSTAYGAGAWLYSVDPNLPMATLPGLAGNCVPALPPLHFAPLGELRQRVALLQG